MTLIFVLSLAGVPQNATPIFETRAECVAYAELSYGPHHSGEEEAKWRCAPQWHSYSDVGDWLE
jgi:hypothetical protein